MREAVEERDRMSVVGVMCSGQWEGEGESLHWPWWRKERGEWARAIWGG